MLGVRFQELLQRPLSGERDVCNESFARRRAACRFPGHSLNALYSE